MLACSVAGRFVRLLLVVVLIAGCARAQPGGRGGPVLTIGGAEPDSLDPLFNNAISQNNLLRLIFEPLVASDGNGNPIPALAAAVPTVGNGGISADGLTITYHLRHDVRWHDGAAFTSRDIAFSTHAMLDGNNPVASRRGYDDIAAVTTPDAYTVRVRLHRRFAPFVASFFSESDFPIYPVPEHLLAHTPNLARASFSGAPVGTGPFRFVRWDRGEKIELAANATYFRGRPHIERVTWRVTTDENTTIAQLRTGELDVAFALSPIAAVQLTGVDGIHLAASPINGYFGLMFNTRRVSDVRIRRAIAAAIDARSVRTQIMHDFDGPAVADLPSFLWAFAPQLRPPAFNPVAARALVEAAGYGPRRPFPLDLALIAGRRTDAAWAVLLQATLARIDVAVHIRSYAPTVYGGTVSQNGILATGRYDATPYFFIAGTDPDDSSQFLCDQRPPAGYNVSFYCSAEMDAAQHLALQSYDRPARKRAYARIEALLLRDVPIVFVGSPRDISAYRSGFGGFAPNPVAPTAAAERWTLAPRAGVP